MRQTKTLSAALLAFACVAGGLASTVVFAPTAAHAAKEQKVGQKVGKPLKEAQEAAQKGDFKSALVKVKEADAVSGKTAYEQQTVNEFLGYVAINLKDYATAAKAFEATVTSGQLDAAQVPARLKAVTQLNYQIKNYDKAKQFANRYLKEVGPDTEIQLMLAQVAYIQQDYKTSGDMVRQVIRAADAAGKPVKKEWLELDMSSAYKLGNMDGVASSLKQLVTRYPSKEYWEQLLDLSMRKTGLSDKDNLDYYRLKRANGLIKDGSELVEMAQLAIQAGLPGEAKTVLEKGFADGQLGGVNKERETRLLTMAKTQAATDQKSLAADEATAAKAATGEASVKIGEAYSSYGMHDKAIAAINAGIAKGGLKNPEDAKLRLALAQLAAGKTADASKTLRDVKAGTGNTSTIADLWRIYVGNKS
ncbi:tetratricopeptide repeat protein [Govanella unica]|uniref:Tetratricopeptide repeat protein n=1 Tax=Govanella unica TaxID=2975056 RepID=A0A9X3U0E0_9PROT|nr:hypothetical protein [Govania unica]MDA5194752.1 hypothetical protein [Govania unica]